MQDPFPPVVTARLDLLALRREQMILLLDDPARLAMQFSIHIPVGLLSPEAIRAAEQKIQRMEIDQDLGWEWSTYFLIVVRKHRTAAGLIGFKGAPDEYGQVEVGYGLHPDWQQRGLASEALGELCAWAFAWPECRVITAETLANNIASQRVLARNGFERNGEVGEWLLWRKTPERGMRVKAPLRVEEIPGAQTNALLRAYIQINHLKHLFRQGWLKRGVPEAQCESVAEHIFGMAMLAWMVADGLDTPVDRQKVIEMTLVHELGEIYTGDITPGDGVDPLEKHRLERESLERIIAGLPVAQTWRALWDEFEAGHTAEARLVRRLDRLEMGLQARIYAQAGFSGMEEFRESAWQAADDPRLRELLQEAWQDSPAT